MTTERDLIQRLANELDAETNYIIHSTGERVTHPDVVEARTYLAQPEPEGPTEWGLLDLGNDVMGNPLPCDPDLLLAFARAVLARWGK